MKRYRVAIIGTGASVGSHFEAIAALGDRLELVAAVDRNDAEKMSLLGELRQQGAAAMANARRLMAAAG